MAKKELSVNEKNKQVKSYRQEKAYKQMRSEVRTQRLSNTGSVLKLFVGFLLIIMLVSFLQGNLRIPTFTGFLEGLSSFDVVPSVPFLNIATITLGDWGVFNFLRDIVQFSLNIVNFFVFIINGLLSCVNFMIFFVRWIFL